MDNNKRKEQASLFAEFVIGLSFFGLCSLVYLGLPSDLHTSNKTIGKKIKESNQHEFLTNWIYPKKKDNQIPPQKHKPCIILDHKQGFYYPIVGYDINQDGWLDCVEQYCGGGRISPLAVIEIEEYSPLWLKAQQAYEEKRK